MWLQMLIILYSLAVYQLVIWKFNKGIYAILNVMVFSNIFYRIRKSTYGTTLNFISILRMYVRGTLRDHKFDLQGPISGTIFRRNSNSTENCFQCNSIVGYHIATTFCTCHDSKAVPCTFHNDHITTTSRMKFPSNLNYDGKIVREMGPSAQISQRIRLWNLPVTTICLAYCWHSFAFALSPYANLESTSL